MSSQKLVEIDSYLIRDYIKANIGAALAEVRTDRADSMVTTEVPANYFFFEKAQGYKAPCVFIICTDVDFRKDEMNANFVNAAFRYTVSVVIEDRAEDYLTVKAWRYQAALHKILDQTQLEDPSQSVKATLVVKNASFSPLFSNAGTAPQVFRKEVALEIDVNHFESF